jgi:pimeloyl-ACP methyl ester carboxylesterase
MNAQASHRSSVDQSPAEELKSRTQDRSKALASAEEHGSPYSERTLQFGEGGHLAGIIAEPADSFGSTDAPAVLMWNVGLNHHVGPYRIYVDLARQAAAAGFRAIRFDLSGLGDSDQAESSSASDAERSVADVRTAMDAIERQLGVHRFVLVGFCSSVDSAHAAGLADERVVGLVNIEGYSFRTLGYRLRYPLRLLDRNRWERWLFNRRVARQSSSVTKEESPEAAVFQRDYPTPARLGREYRSLVARGVRMLFLYVRGDSLYEYKDQLFEFLGDTRLASHMDVEYFPEADHIFSRVTDREAAVHRVVDYLRERFSSRVGS